MVWRTEKCKNKRQKKERKNFQKVSNFQKVDWGTKKKAESVGDSAIFGAIMELLWNNYSLFLAVFMYLHLNNLIAGSGSSVPIANAD